ncbi:peptidase M48 [Pseudomonas sp. S150]|uniref:M48 family metallopeptidase n=1 Tax=Pseudomonas sp. S150 TaxID=2559074 RepID=UPI0010713D41|nr:M48 family metallopeptidase [Pseudomonas sp. S150]QBR31594.1 peptidase M48 [Pseudomonas sp. S150]
MNFFQQQRQAKRRSVLLVILMGLAVLSLILMSCLLMTLPVSDGDGNTVMDLELSWEMFTAVSVVVTSIVLVGGLVKYAELSAGGKVIARRLGGRLINHSAQTLEEQRLVNVVEEMALASGTVVPSVYLLPDLGINAFAAGFTAQDAVIGVTQGAITLLSRDELQGVIAHEFSHIYNGDMRLNTRLVAVVHGILVIGLTGSFILRGMDDVRRSPVNRTQPAILTVMFGTVLCIVGYGGTVFGNLIKAAVSRQREFLADATAVQYTRDPNSIAGALKKIGGYALGAKINAARAAEFSHLYFGSGTSSFDLMSSHPDLSERIRRIDASWDGTFVKIAAPPQDSMVARAVLPVPDAFSGVPDTAMSVVYDMNAVQASVAAIGAPRAEHLIEARRVLEKIPQKLKLKLAARSTDSAQALVYGLLLSRSDSLRALQLSLLESRASTARCSTSSMPCASICHYSIRACACRCWIF